MKGDKTPYVEAKISGIGRKVENSVGVNIPKIRKISKRRRKTPHKKIALQFELQTMNLLSFRYRCCC